MKLISWHRRDVVEERTAHKRLSHWRWLAVLAATLGLCAAVPSVAGASYNYRDNGNFRVTVTWNTGTTYVTDVGSRVTCVNNFTGHHLIQVNYQTQAVTSNDTYGAGTYTTAGWHPNTTFAPGTRFGNAWSYVSGCVPSGGGSSFVPF